ncbi:hypothetical protein D3C76_1536040 [compost metagenome]
MPLMIHQPDRYQAMVVGLFFHRQYLAVGEAQIPITAVTRGQRYGAFITQGLVVQLLVGLIDEQHTVMAQAE